jgi:hypothetical protein
LFLDITVSFAAITVLVIAGISYTAHRRRLYDKLHPPSLSDYERHVRRYEVTGDERELKLALESKEVQ